MTTAQILEPPTGNRDQEFVSTDSLKGSADMRLVQVILKNGYPSVFTPVFCDTDSPNACELWVETVKSDGISEIVSVSTRRNRDDEWEEVPIVSEGEALA